MNLCFFVRKLGAILFLFAALVFLLSVNTAHAQNYGVGSEGIKGATLPGPGYYYVMYNQLYSADKVTDKDGDEIHNGFDLTTVANVHRFVWITDKKILGADYGMNLIVPLVNVDIEMSDLGVDESSFGLGDINLEPFVLGWHGPQYDYVFGLSMYFPTGSYDKNDPSSTGKDHYDIMLSTGGTYYPDAAKKWSVSVLTRYEKHLKNRDLDVTYGDDFSLDWGVGKVVGLFDVGVSGYAHWQITADDGDDATSNDKDSIMGIGPEVNYAIPSIKSQVKVKFYKEFNAKDTTEGNALWVTFAKAF
ncbi:transporter [Seleniivibrio sp.]|uniref:SphA family protein n=1 Tax=Seleniivibrio sp. TaxID=2898801 RepID=UPI0025FEC69F|nr:transporter [Seleniivibrio sp.]MCD8554821.1 transporter [Seleniivibrio sp.]